MSAITTPATPTMFADPATDQVTRPDLDIDFIVSQLRGTFEAKLDQMLGLPADHPSCAAYSRALDAINAALARMHDGTYGICEVCNGSISAARLEVVPTTTSCVSCNANRRLS